MKNVWKGTKRGPHYDCYGRIQEFLNSGLKADRVYYPHKTAASCRNALTVALKRERILNVRAIQSGTYVILLKLDM